MSKSYTATELFIGLAFCGILLLGMVAIGATGGLQKPDEATRILRQSGYTQIEITGWRPFAAGNDDTFSTGFRAKSPSGETVTGTVTSGWFKGGTVRLD